MDSFEEILGQYLIQGDDEETEIFTCSNCFDVVSSLQFIKIIQQQSLIQ